MSRDRIKNDKYFEEYIIEQNKRIAKFQLVANQQDDIEKKTKLYRIVANLQKDLFSAKYSIEANIEELRRIFNRKFPQKISLLEHFLSIALLAMEVVPTPVEEVESEKAIRDLADRPILRAAINANVDVLLTGDKDFLESGVTNPKIMTAADFLEI